MPFLRAEACGRRRKRVDERPARTPVRGARPRNAASKGSRERRCPAERFRWLQRTSYQQGLVGGIDAFVTKLNASGSALTYSTFLGGTDLENGFGIAVDGTGKTYVTGRTQS